MGEEFEKMGGLWFQLHKKIHDPKISLTEKHELLDQLMANPDISEQQKHLTCFQLLGSGVLKGDGSYWSLKDGYGYPLAHIAAKKGVLPYNFDQWDVRDTRGRSVAYVVALYNHFPIRDSLTELIDAFMNDDIDSLPKEESKETGTLDRYVQFNDWDHPVGDKSTVLLESVMAMTDLLINYLNIGNFFQKDISLKENNGPISFQIDIEFADQRRHLKITNLNAHNQSEE